jgi:hypothetical protein
MADDLDRSGGQLVGRLRSGPLDAAPGQDVDYWYVPADPEPAAAERTINLRDYWAILVKRKWLILACVLSTLALGIGVTVLTTPIYTANATLQIDREAARVIVGQDVQPQEQFTAGEESSKPSMDCSAAGRWPNAWRSRLGSLGTSGF